MTAPRIAPLVTLWQEQITASSGSADGPSATGPPAPGGQHQLLGRRPAAPSRSTARSVPYASASPTRTPPSSVAVAADRPASCRRRAGVGVDARRGSRRRCRARRRSDATSTPSSFSLVDRSAPVKLPAVAPPRDRPSAAVSRHLVAGRDQPVHPAVRGQRALADREDRAGRRCGTARRRRCRRARRPRSPQSRASWSRGRTPAEKTTRSVGEFGAVGQRHAGHRAVLVRRRSPACRRPCARSGPSPRWCAAAPRRRPRRPAPASAAARTPRRACRVRAPCSAPAASSPSSPPPTTAPVRRALFAYSSIASRSSMVR